MIVFTWLRKLFHIHRPITGTKDKSIRWSCRCGDVFPGGYALKPKATRKR